MPNRIVREGSHRARRGWQHIPWTLEMPVDIHPVANIFPAMSPAEYAALRDDIKANGQREPVWTWNGALIDGRHRRQACDELGIDCATRVYDGAESSLVSFVVSLNLKRRHLSESQRGMVAARLATLRVGTNQHAQICAPSQSEAAEMLNVSRRTVQTAAKVHDEAPPEVIAAVDSGALKVSAAAQVLELPQEEREETIASIITAPEQAKEIVREAVKAHVAHNSGNNEWYTPAEYIEAAREVLGTIDVDPASSAIANERVRAAVYYTAEENGLLQRWDGKVWMNPPYAQPLIADFSAALVEKFRLGEVTEACVLVNNATDTAWFRMLAESSDATCFTKGRIRFMDPEGKPSGAPLQGQSILYFGPNPDCFADAFRRFGYVFVGSPVALAA